MEVLAGARDDQREIQLRRLLTRCALLAFDPAPDFEGAARIYRRCRAQGVTPRGLTDCMIASVAWRRQATLLAHDVDLDRVASVVGIVLDPASTRAESDPRHEPRRSQPDHSRIGRRQVAEKADLRLTLQATVRSDG